MTDAASLVRIALLTPPGRGALAVVGVSGPGAIDLLARSFTPRGRQPLAARPDGAIIFGRWGDPERGEELVVVRHAADRLEVHCHGGLAASAAVLASLAQSRTGFSLSQKTDFSLSPKTGVSLSHPHPAVSTLSPCSMIELEAREALASVSGPKAARILCRQLAGVLADELERIDFLRQAGDAVAVVMATERLVLASRVGLRLVKPWRVVVSGPVNAGKSSLVNALAGFSRSIVSAEPGTTRDVLETRIVLDGWEIDLIDTAGLREPDEVASATERAGIERALAAAVTADLVLQVGQASACHVVPNVGQASACHQIRIATASTQARQAEVFSALPRQAEACPTLQVISRCDLAPGVVASPAAILTSALTGQGIGTLAHAIVAALVPEEAADPSLLAGPVPFTPRQVALAKQVGQASAWHK